MTKDQARQLLLNLVDSLKLTRQEYQTLMHALNVLTAPPVAVVKPEEKQKTLDV